MDSTHKAPTIADSPTATQTPPLPATPDAAKISPQAVKLVPSPSLEYPAFELQYPEGWRITQGEPNVDFFPPQGVYPKFTVFTGQHVKGSGIPVDEKAAAEPYVKAGYTGVTAQRIEWPGAFAAFRTRLDIPRSGFRTSLVAVSLYGKIWYQSIQMETRSEDYAQWEPVFNDMVKTFKPLRLNADFNPAKP